MGLAKKVAKKSAVAKKALSANAVPQFTKPLRFVGLEVSQRTQGPTLVLFTATAEQILGFAEVEELTPSTKGPQREQKEARVHAITQFLQKGPANTIPTAVILAFDQAAAMFVENEKPGLPGTLKILDPVNKKGTIVDGQHRLVGIQQADPLMQVAVVALINADPVERAFQFLVINNKASKVPPKHIKALLANMKTTSLNDRLKAAKLSFDENGINDVDLINTDPESPFYHSVDWSTTPKDLRIVQATAIESSLDYLKNIGIPDYEDRDIRRAVFLVIWKTIKNEWPKLWVADSKLLSKVGIHSMTRLIVDRITQWADIDDLGIEVTNLEQIETWTRDKILKYMDPRFWQTPWSANSSGGFDTNQGRERVLAAITLLFRNVRKDIPWYTDIEIIDQVAAKDLV